MSYPSTLLNTIIAQSEDPKTKSICENMLDYFELNGKISEKQAETIARTAKFNKIECDQELLGQYVYNKTTKHKATTAELMAVVDEEFLKNAGMETQQARAITQIQELINKKKQESETTFKDDRIAQLHELIANAHYELAKLHRR